MGSKLTRESISLFESIKQFDVNGHEYWTSRNLSRILEYADYRNFVKVIEKAKIACSNSGQVVADHFVDITKMVPLSPFFHPLSPTFTYFHPINNTPRNNKH